MDGLIEVNQDNIDREHICCAISDKKTAQVKKDWMQARFADGYRFYKLEGRGKAFIEFVPAENAWAPVSAEGYLFIDCFWVAGALADHGYGTKLLELCIGEAKRLGKKGIVALSSDKKRPFLSDPVFFRKYGFQVADTAPPYFELLCLPLCEGAEQPCFRSCAKEGGIGEQGVVIYYTDHCPWNAKYLPLLEKAAQERNAPVTLRRIGSKEEAQESPSPFSTYAVYYNGEFLTNEMMSDKKFVKFLEAKGL